MYVKNPTLLWQNACECLGRTFHIQVWEFCYFYLENFRQRNSKITVHDIWTHQSCCLGTIIQLFSLSCCGLKGIILCRECFSREMKYIKILGHRV